MKYFEDLAVGQVLDLGRYDVSEQEILEFGRRFDPQAIHTDPAAARESFFGGLIASGWHSCSIMMRLLADTIARERLASTGSPGIEACKWLVPVRPGDCLQGRLEILEARRSRSRPFGIVRSRNTLTNQKGEEVLEMMGMGLYALRPGTEDGA